MSVFSSPHNSLSAEPSQGIVNLKAEPWSACASTQIFPPLRSMIFLQIARPIPLPGYSVRACRRWKTTKIFSAYSGAMPIPLSRTLNNQCWLAFSAWTEIAGGSFPRNLIRVPDQILEDLRHLRAIRPHRRQRPMRDHRAALLNRRTQTQQNLFHRRITIDTFASRAIPTTAAQPPGIAPS